VSSIHTHTHTHTHTQRRTSNGQAALGRAGSEGGHGLAVSFLHAVGFVQDEQPDLLAGVEDGGWIVCVCVCVCVCMYVKGMKRRRDRNGSVCVYVSM
jgi:hypothetical protein